MRFGVSAVGILVCVALSVGCTKHNPRACLEGACTDSSFPFCDVQGTLGGAQNECIAVECVPGAVAECRGSEAVVCNEEGTSYEVLPCIRGCDSANHGCLIEASNGLGAYLDMIESPQDMTLLTGTIDTLTGEIDGSTTVPNFLVPAPQGGVSIRVFVARNVRLGNITVMSSSFVGSPAFAIIATEQISVEGTLRLGRTIAGGPRTPGAIDSGPCVGGMSILGTVDGYNVYSGAGGGGGAASAGALGGNVGPATGGSGGVANDPLDLIPLRGGCGSGLDGKGGGGAIQLTSLVAIRVAGRIEVRGEPGTSSTQAMPLNSGGYVGGGGGGGGVLLEAPLVEIGDGVAVLADGGGGASRQFNGQEQYGGTCPLTSCGAGGDGATAFMPIAQAGEDVTESVPMTMYSGGGGGGGLGRIRINTVDGTYTKGSSTIENAIVTTGLATRF